MPICRLGFSTIKRSVASVRVIVIGQSSGQSSQPPRPLKGGNIETRLLCLSIDININIMYIIPNAWLNQPPHQFPSPFRGSNEIAPF